MGHPSVCPGEEIRADLGIGSAAEIWSGEFVACGWGLGILRLELASARLAQNDSRREGVTRSHPVAKDTTRVGQPDEVPPFRKNRERMGHPPAS
jgi:hypothetical protein